MRKKHILVTGIMILALSASLFGQSEEIQNPWSVKVFGGGWFGRNGDVRTYVLAYDRFFEQWSQAYGYSKTGGLDWPGAGGAFGGEIARRFSSRASAGLDLEIFSKSHSGSFDMGSGRSDRMDLTIAAVSVTAFGDYAWPVTKALSVTLKAGLGALFGSLDQTLDSRTADLGRVLVKAQFNAAGFAGQAGIGLEWKLSARLALSLEGGYRLASLSKWSGEDVHDWGTGSARHSGTLYYVDIQIDSDRIPTVYYPGLLLGDSSLATQGVASRLFKADFSGFYCHAGLLVRW